MTIGLVTPAQAAPPERGFISGKPADNWEQALVTGNGKLGAMVFGVPLDVEGVSESAGINRLETENERVLQRKPSQ